MEHVDEKIIKALNAHKSGAQGTIETGMYIREERYEFGRIELFEQKMSILLPTTFMDMPLEQARLKYPMEQRPQIIKTNSAGDINFTFSLIDQNINNAQVKQIMQFFKNVLKMAQPTNVFHEENVEQIGDITVSWFDYVSNGYDKKIFNLVYLLPIDGKLMHGIFNCAIDDAENWRAVALDVMRSITDISAQGGTVHAGFTH